MNILIIFLLFIFFIVLSTKEKFKLITQPPQTNLAALSRNELQSPPNIDLSKINWSKLDDYTYSRVVCLIQGCDEKAIIKNLPISTSS
jgi:hypothetical protein